MKTLKELADIGAAAAFQELKECTSLNWCMWVNKANAGDSWNDEEPARQAFAAAVRDAVLADTPTPRTDQLNAGLLSACQESAIYNFMLDHARQLERDIAELNDRLIDRQKTLMAELVKNSSGNRNPCDWKQDNDGNWDTSCNQCMCFDYAPPFEPGYRFCHHCGKPIKFIEHEPEPPFEDFGGME